MTTNISQSVQSLWDMFRAPPQAIAHALSTNDTRRALRLLDKHSVDPNTCLSARAPHKKYQYQDTGTTLLHWAVWCENEKVVWALLTRGANPNSSTYFNDTPLHWAAKRANMRILALLIAFGGDPTLKNTTWGGSFMYGEETYHYTALDICNQKNMVLSVDVLAEASAQHQQYMLRQHVPFADDVPAQIIGRRKM